MSFKTRLIMPALGVAAMLAVAPSLSAQSDKDFQITLPENIVWKEAGQGVKIAVVYGDPSKPGQYVIRAHFPPGVMSSPHFHGEDRHITVIQGTWNAGKDDSWDPAATVPLKTGSYMFHPAGGVHYDGSAGAEGTIVQIVGMGPSKTTFLYPKEGSFGAPRKLN
ncbi:MAG: cupin domain-containing protein [Oxalobacteraceae bacterium]